MLKKPEGMDTFPIVDDSDIPRVSVEVSVVSTAPGEVSLQVEEVDIQSPVRASSPLPPGT